MKKLNYILLSVVAITLTFYSCVEDTDYDTPQIACIEPTLTGNPVELSNIITLYETNGGVVTFDENYEDYITVYVTSSDETGNFYKELFVQDKAADPTAAVKLSINVPSLYTKYEPGRKLFVYMNGLAIGKNQSGELMIAELNDTGISDFIRENKARTNILRSCETLELTPLVLTSPTNIDESHLGMLVQLDNMQFDNSLLNGNFVDPLDSFDTHYNITSCDDDSTITLETSTYASFKNSPLPQGSGSVAGILTRDYGDDFDVLRVNNPDAFSFDGERCDPLMIDCGLASTEGTNVLFEDDFSSYGANSIINGNGWTNYMQEGTEQWSTYSDAYSLGISAQLNPYNNGSVSIISWLITPAIDMDAQDGEVLAFKTSNSFSDGSTLQVLYSNDWDGDENTITTATWMKVSAATIVPDDEFYQDWVNSGFVDLSCATGTSYIAFKYTGDGGDINSNFNGTYELDDVKITSD